MPSHPILVAEDEPLIAEELSLTLREAGYDVIGPYARLGDALEAAASVRPAVAVIDMMLRDDSAAPLADYLSQRRIPYVIVSGLRTPQDGHYRGAAWLSKPFSPQMLLRAVDRARDWAKDWAKPVLES